MEPARICTCAQDVYMQGSTIQQHTADTVLILLHSIIEQVTLQAAIRSKLYLAPSAGGSNRLCFMACHAQQVRHCVTIQRMPPGTLRQHAPPQKSRKRTYTVLTLSTRIGAQTQYLIRCILLLVMAVSAPKKLVAARRKQLTASLIVSAAEIHSEIA